MWAEKSKVNISWLLIKCLLMGSKAVASKVTQLKALNKFIEIYTSNKGAGTSKIISKFEQVIAKVHVPTIDSERQRDSYLSRKTNIPSTKKLQL